MGATAAALPATAEVEFISKFPEHIILIHPALVKKLTDAADHIIGEEVIREKLEASFHMGRLSAGPELAAALKKHRLYGTEFVTLAELATWPDGQWRSFLKEADRRCKLAHPGDKIDLYDEVLGDIVLARRAAKK